MKSRSIVVRGGSGMTSDASQGSDDAGSRTTLRRLDTSGEVLVVNYYDTPIAYR